MAVCLQGHSLCTACSSAWAFPWNLDDSDSRFFFSLSWEDWEMPWQIQWQFSKTFLPPCHFSYYHPCRHSSSVFPTATELHLTSSSFILIRRLWREPSLNHWAHQRAKTVKWGSVDERRWSTDLSKNDLSFLWHMNVTGQDLVFGTLPLITVCWMWPSCSASGSSIASNLDFHFINLLLYLITVCHALGCQNNVYLIRCHLGKQAVIMDRSVQNWPASALWTCLN